MTHDECVQAAILFVRKMKRFEVFGADEPSHLCQWWTEYICTAHGERFYLHPTDGQFDKWNLQVHLSGRTN